MASSSVNPLHQKPPRFALVDQWLESRFGASLNPLRRQLARVSRRMFLQSLFDILAWCWAGALLLIAVWLLVEPLIPEARPDWLAWAVPGGIGVVATLLAIVLAVVRAPNRLVVALALDERFNLKERVTTSLTLDDQTASLPAGQALLADAADRVRDLDIGERFPLRMRWNAALVPLAGLALAAVVFFYDPQRTQATTQTPDGKQPIANKEELEKKLAEAKKKALEKKKDEKPKGEKGAVFDDDLQKILNKDRKTEDDVRDQFKEITELKDKVKKDQDDLKDRADAMRDQLQQLNKNAGSNAKDGPAKEMQKALEKGDFKKAQDELDKLRKKMEDNGLTDKEKEQLQQQLKDMKEQLKKAADPNEAKKELEQLKRDGKLTQEQFDKAMEKINDNAAKMKDSDKKDLQEIADALKEADQALKDGNADKAADALKRAGEVMKKTDDLNEMQDVDQEELDQLAEVQRALRNGMSGATPGAGRRPEGDAHETGSYTSKLKGKHDSKGSQELTGYAPGSSFKKKSSSEIAGEIKQASQDAPETIERQRIPRAASEMARGYFENIRKLSDDEKKDK
jgi:uncharacterized coiled-coil DUF342 family protein